MQRYKKYKIFDYLCKVNKEELLEIMMKKIAIPTREDMVDDHFGHCAYYTVVKLRLMSRIRL